MLEEAVKCYNSVILSNKKDEKVFFHRAKCERKLEKYNEALKDIDECLKIVDDVAKYWIEKAQILSFLGRYDEISNQLKKQVSLSQNLMSLIILWVLLRYICKILKKP